MTATPNTLVGDPTRTAPGSAFSDSLEMLCTVRFDGRITEANASLLGGLGCDERDLLGSLSLDHVHCDDQAATLERATELLAGLNVTVFESRYRCRDGSYRWLAWSARSEPGAAQVHCAARDVTESRRHRDLVDKLLAELERSNTDLAQFAYVASHDLSEPLRMVSSYVGLLASRYAGQLDDDADEFIGYAVDGAGRMKALIDDLLAYCRSGVDVAVLRQVDCGALVHSAVADLHQAIGDSGASIEVGDLPVVEGDPGQLSQLFQNLLSNALKFVAPDVPARVRVTARREDDAWCFSGYHRTVHGDDAAVHGHNSGGLGDHCARDRNTRMRHPLDDPGGRKRSPAVHDDHPRPNRQQRRPDDRHRPGSHHPRNRRTGHEPTPSRHPALSRIALR